MPTPPVDVPNEIIVETYDRLAALYDRIVAPMQAQTRQRALELLAAERGEYVVELGCGPGHALVSFGEYVGPEGRVIGLDAARVCCLGFASEQFGKERASGSMYYSGTLGHPRFGTTPSTSPSPRNR